MKSSYIASVESVATQYETLPIASSNNVGKIYQYIGETNQNYTKGYFYECIRSGQDYVYEQIDVGPGGGATGDYVEKKRYLPATQITEQGETVIYTGSTTSEATQGKTYTLGIETYNFGYDGRLLLVEYRDERDINVHAVIKADEGDTFAANDKVYIINDETGLYDVDYLVESATDNNIYPLTKVDQPKYLCGDRGMTYTIIHVKKWIDPNDQALPVDISDLDDVEITNPADGQIMSFDETSEKWKNKDWVVDSEENTYEPDLDITDENGNVLVSFANGHIKTKNFDSSNISQGKIGEANQTYHLSFSVNTGIANITDSTNNDQTNATYATDWGAIKLPPNYTAGGTPVELVVKCHGTGGVIDSSTEFTGDVNIFLQNGMAVCDINGNPGQTSDSNDRGYGTPKSYRSYCKGLNYILTNFNINGLFVYGTSMGGLASTRLAENFPGVKVQGAFCPCIDVFKEAFLRPRNGATQRSKICTGFGFSGTAPTFGTKGSYSADEQAYILANKEKIRGRNNMLKSTTGIDLDEYLSTYATVYTEQTAEQALYANAVKYRQVPIKIWHGIDDQTVPYKYSKYFIEMCRKGGCIADLRTFPSGTGHSAWSVGTKTVTTKYGGEITVSNSIYEMYVWFDGFR